MVLAGIPDKPAKLIPQRPDWLRWFYLKNESDNSAAHISRVDSCSAFRQT